MYNPFGGNKFPYSNFHELNLDWIIEIAKNFLDQYSHIQETISTGLDDLNAKATELEGLLQAWYDTHSEDIANELANSVLELEQVFNNKLTAFNIRVDEKVNEAIESIPSDYTHLALLEREVPDFIVKILSEQLTGNLVTGKAITNTNTENPYTDAEYITISVTPGDILYITGYHFANPYPLYIALSDSTIIETYTTTGELTITNLKYLVPANVNTLKVNGSISRQPPIVNKYASKNLSDLFINGKITDNEILHNVIKLFGTDKAQTYINTQNTEGSLPNAFLSTFPVTGGDTVFISGYHWANPTPAFIVLDSSDNVIDSYNTTGAKYITTYRYKVPYNATTIKVNGRNYPGGVYHCSDKTLHEFLSEHINPDMINYRLEDIDTANKHTGAVLTTSLAEHTISSGDYYRKSVTPGQNIFIRGWHWANPYPAYMLLYNGELKYAYTQPSGSGKIETTIVIPEGIDEIVVNGHLAVNTFCPAYAGTFQTSNLFANRNKKRILFIGDSYAQGYTHGTQNEGWCKYCQQALSLSDADVVISAQGGARMSTTNSNNYTNLIPTTYSPDYFTHIVIAGGFNDHSNTSDQIFAGLQAISDKAHGCYPWAKVIVGTIAWIKQGTGEGALDNWNTVLDQIVNTVIPTYYRCQEVNIGYANNVEYWINNYGLSDEDGYHPNEIGNKRIGYAMANAILTGSANLKYYPALRV